MLRPFINFFNALWHSRFGLNRLVPGKLSDSAQVDYDDGDSDDFDTQPHQKAQPNVFATGTFEHVTLYDLMLALVHGNKNGKVEIQMGSHKAMMLVLNGRLVTAMYQDSLGDEAVLRIFSDAEDHSDAEFFVRAADPLDFPETSYTVRRATDKLLFDVAMALDEKRQGVAA